MKLITYVINSLFLLLCIHAAAMEQSLICEKAIQTDVKSSLKSINKLIIHDHITRMNMVRENDGSKEGKSSDKIDPKIPIIKLSGCFI